MVSSGVFIVWYWATVLAAGSSALGRMPIVRAIDEWSSAATRFIGDRPLAIGAAVVVAVAMERVRARAARR